MFFSIPCSLEKDSKVHSLHFTAYQVQLPDRNLCKADSERQQKNNKTAIHCQSCRFTWKLIYITRGVYPKKTIMSF